MIKINIKKQMLEYYEQDNLVKSYFISTAKNGAGEAEDSYCTPRGRHQVYAKIGAKLPIGAVLAAREPTGEIYSQTLAEKCPDRDWILTRIIWLDGLERFNKNTKKRYIYIHGVPDEIAMGRVGSKGCIRMSNKDIVELFDNVKKGEIVDIINHE